MGDLPFDTRPYTYLFSMDVAAAAQNACYTPPEPATPRQELCAFVYRVALVAVALSPWAYIWWEYRP